MRRGRDQVGDRLAFPRAGRPLHDKARTSAHFLDDFCLRGIGVDHLNDLRRVQQIIQLVLGAEDRSVFLEPVGQETAQQVAFCKGIHWPGTWIKIAMHQKFCEGKEAQLHSIAVDRPSRLARHGLPYLIEVFGGCPFFGLVNLGQQETEILPQPFLQWQVGRDVIVTGNHVEGRGAFVAHKLHRQQHQWRLAIHLGRGAFAPAQESGGQIQDVQPLFFFGRARIRGQAQQAAGQSLGTQRRFKKDVGQPI